MEGREKREKKMNQMIKYHWTKTGDRDNRTEQFSRKKWRKSKVLVLQNSFRPAGLELFTLTQEQGSVFTECELIINNWISVSV